MQKLRLNVLISAHELNPYGGSECAEGWNVVTRLGKYHNITVLYARGSQFYPMSYEQGIREYLSKHTNSYNIKFIPVEQPKATRIVTAINKLLSRNIDSIGNPFLYFIGYFFWEKSAYKIAEQKIAESKFDIIHHLTSISFREPGLLWKLPVPFIWGPTGGLSKIPFQFYRFLGLKSSFQEVIRNIINQIQFRANYRIKKAIQKSSLIYTFSKEDQFLFHKKSGRKPKLLLDSAAITSKLNQVKIPSDSEHLRVLWCGQLIKRKSLNIILFALNSDPQLKQKIILKVVGGGPLEKYYKSLSENLNMGNCIEWIGMVDRQTVFNIMNESDLLIHSSYREGTPHVIPEALSHGLPVVCHDINGMSIAIDDKCGIKIPLVSPAKSIEGFKLALLKLMNHPDELRRLQSGAIKRAHELSWDVMAETIANDYISIHHKNCNLKIGVKSEFKLLPDNISTHVDT